MAGSILVLNLTSEGIAARFFTLFGGSFKPLRQDIVGGLINLLDRKGIITKQELLEEIKKFLCLARNVPVSLTTSKYWS
jgi:hypothetical protein